MPQLRTLVQQHSADRAVVIQAIRALAAMGDAGAVPLLSRLMIGRLPGRSRSAARASWRCAALPDNVPRKARSISLFDAPAARAGRRPRVRWRVWTPESFTLTLSGLDADPDWTVRVAQATALGTLPAGVGVPRLQLMLEDRDNRVLPAVLAALVAAKAPDAEAHRCARA